VSDINVTGRKRDDSSSPLEPAVTIAAAHTPSQGEN